MKLPEAAQIEAEIEGAAQTLLKFVHLFTLYQDDFSESGRRDPRDAVFLADLLVKTYTCLETVFLRISRAFENDLPPNGWHKELLRKMRLEIPGIRHAVISEQSYQWLDALRRFRHFQRYYYDIELDWKRLDILAANYREHVARITAELQDYGQFCRQLADS